MRQRLIRPNDKNYFDNRAVSEGGHEIATCMHASYCSKGMIGGVDTREGKIDLEILNFQIINEEPSFSGKSSQVSTPSPLITYSTRAVPVHALPVQSHHLPCPIDVKASAFSTFPQALSTSTLFLAFTCSPIMIQIAPFQPPQQNSRLGRVREIEIKMILMRLSYSELNKLCG